MDLERLIRRERLASMGINAVLSAAFFLGVFGTEVRPLAFAAPDNLARDFLPQGGVIALMATLVPALLVRRSLGGSGRSVPTTRQILGQAVISIAGGLAVSALLMLACFYGPGDGMGWTSAFAMKVVFGGLLGSLVTDRSLRRLYRVETA
ncbi:hypothetical protein [Novosphingobium jiangmenense]|uniref:Uncharacterized protein n=1 Tax=Novosphingobium jiangmenense TaxID=2791981 RepID=A0ABS0HBY3_9SPHN|nr:hypothetical protein [Novosphingobium jiangmenense]MBF9149638.1 hypothetical protein [Novosphingobium jiangmenense]